MCILLPTSRTQLYSDHHSIYNPTYTYPTPTLFPNSHSFYPTPTLTRPFKQPQMIEDVLFKGIKKPKNKKIKKIEQSYRIEGTELPKLESFEGLKTKTIFDSPKLVQQIVIPYILKDMNVCVQSFTGSGKTLSYLLPLVELALERPVKAIILVPTDQLKAQVQKVINNEIKGQSKPEIIVLKPDEVGHREGVTHLIIDEADVMIHQESLSLFKSLSTVLEDCFVSVFSATLNKEVEKIIGMFKDTTKIYISNKGSITHRFVFGTKDRVKHLSLEQIIEEGVEVPCLVFVNDNETGRKLAQRIPKSAFFEEGGNKEEEGDKKEVSKKGTCNDESIIKKEVNRKGSVSDIDTTLNNNNDHNTTNDHLVNEFRLKKIWFLFTTDILSRGVDFINTKSVINYDFPPTKTTFIHRAGRVNRNTTGQKVITIYTVDDFKKLEFVVDFLKENGSKVEEHIERIIQRKDKKIMD